ncbi:hypothetical protein [Rheinheimera sp. F8]|uniref:hypothetical protein n=1 Tax=Rheinheimera sp. F8 TaxID=1763998 RepID=UPI000744BDCE|nr:hypothetical protein [Rheinheimera sp. F8]ALZ75383.1 hypothetical protein ATY27_06195 [Rheinheimera sp. F8]ALZ75803.1 hypothetical protein ATY27_08510 [Rheinheimera sp. F8]
MQQLTKNHKAQISACQHCDAKENLESAHVHGRDRNDIIESILSQDSIDGIVSVNIEKFEERFIEEHQPLEKSILILCRECHRKYDAKPKQAKQKLHSAESTPKNSTKRAGVLTITFEPSDEQVFKQKLLLNKQAVIETRYANGTVESKVWNADRFNASSNLLGNLRSRPEFRAGKWQEAGITRVHLYFSNEPN